MVGRKGSNFVVPKGSASCSNYLTVRTNPNIVNIHHYKMWGAETVSNGEDRRAHHKWWVTKAKKKNNRKTMGYRF